MGTMGTGAEISLCMPIYTTCCMCFTAVGISKQHKAAVTRKSANIQQLKMVHLQSRLCGQFPQPQGSKALLQGHYH